MSIQKQTLGLPHAPAVPPCRRTTRRPTSELLREEQGVHEVGQEADAQESCYEVLDHAASQGLPQRRMPLVDAALTVVDAILTTRHTDHVKALDARGPDEA